MPQSSALALRATAPEPWRISPAQARAAVTRALMDGTAPLGLPAALLLEHGSLKLFRYEPRGEDLQPPHDQDEVYVVISGCGTFALGESEASLGRVTFGPGDALFAAAGALHRFEDFTDDFATWGIMYGPVGGEEPGT